MRLRTTTIIIKFLIVINHTKNHIDLSTVPTTLLQNYDVLRHITAILDISSLLLNSPTLRSSSVPPATRQSASSVNFNPTTVRTNTPFPTSRSPLRLRNTLHNSRMGTYDATERYMDNPSRTMAMDTDIEIVMLMGMARARARWPGNGKTDMDLDMHMGIPLTGELTETLWAMTHSVTNSKTKDLSRHRNG